MPPPEAVEAAFTLQALQATDGATQFSGILQNDRGEPLPGARMSIGRTALSATSNDKGQFNFADVPAGKIDLFVDGRTVSLVSQPNVQYPSMHFEAIAVKGAANRLTHPIYLPALYMSEAKIVGGNEDVVLKMPGIDGYEMTIFANSVTFPDGSKQGPLVVSPIAQDKLPMAPPGGYTGFMAPAATLQPSGTRFDPPAQLKLPNTAGFRPGEKRPVFQWDHDLGTFVQMGQATVTDDGLYLITDPGTGISKAGWHPIPDPPPPEQCPKGGGDPSCKECTTLDSTAGKCPKKYCKPNNGASCNDNKFCTEVDKCIGGACVGTPKKDQKVGSVSSTTNLAVFNVFYKVAKVFGVQFDDLVVALKGELTDKCCEEKKSVVREAQASLEGKIAITFGPKAVPGAGYSIRIPNRTLPPGIPTSIDLGLIASGEMSASLIGQVETQDCSGKGACWGGGGTVELSATLGGGAIIRDGKIVLLQATASGKTSVQGNVIMNCVQGEIKGQWGGITIPIVLEFYDGFIHFDYEYQAMQPETLTPYVFTLPDPKSLF